MITRMENTALQHSAHAAWLSDQVFEAIKLPDLNMQFLHLNKLDVSLQSFLAVVMERSSVSGIFCGTIAMTIR